MKDFSPIEDILDPNEQLYWAGKPSKTPFIIKNSTFGVLLLAIGIFAFKINTEDIWRWTSGGFCVLSGTFHIGKNLLASRNTLYALTEKRAIIWTRHTGFHLKIIELDKIIDLEIKSNFFESKLNVGTIKFFTGEVDVTDRSPEKVYDEWQCINEPYKVFKEFKAAMDRYKAIRLGSV